MPPEPNASEGQATNIIGQNDEGQAAASSKHSYKDALRALCTAECPVLENRIAMRAIRVLRRVKT